MKKQLLLLLFWVSLVFTQIVDLSFSSSWQLDNGVELSGDTLRITGSSSEYRKAQLTVQVPPEIENIYFVAKVLLEDIGSSDKSYKAAKFKVYDGSGATLQAYNMPALIQDEWYTTGMVLKSFDKKGISTITVEFSMQNIEGVMRVVLPQLLDAPPASEYSFPFDLPVDTRISIAINSNDKYPFLNSLLSVNSHFVWASSSWGDDEIKELLSSRLKLGNLRFPGGTVGNFYDWESDGFYGDEWTFLSPSRKKAYEKGFRFDFLGFVENCKASDATATLMFNVIRDSHEKAKSRLKDRIASGIDIEWIEMGNENFFTEQAFGNVSTLSNYITHTKALAAVLREQNAAIKVAVNLNHHDFSEGSWNLELAKERYYDAAVIHPYVQTNSFLLNNYSTKIMLSAYKTTQHRIAEFKKHFGSIPLLFTEWGVLSEGSPSNFVQALSVADMFLSIVEGAEKGVVRQAGIHMLYHSDNYNEATLYFKNGTEMKRTRLGVLYEKVSQLFYDRELYSAKGTSAQLEEGLQAINARALDYGDSIKIFVVNKTPQNSLMDISLDGTLYNGPHIIESFTEEILGDSLGYSFSENPWQVVSGIGTPTLEGNAVHIVTIPKSSSFVVTAQINPENSVHIRKVNSGIVVTASRKATVRLLSLQGKELESYQDVRSVSIGQAVARGCYLLQWNIGGIVGFKKVFIK